MQEAININTPAPVPSGAEKRKRGAWIGKTINFLRAALEFLFGGHVIVWAARKIIMFAGRTAESTLLVAALWITSVYTAHDFMYKISFGLAPTLTELSILSFALLPEIILFSAIVTTYNLWRQVASDKRNKAAWAWAGLYTLPTVCFFIMAIIAFTAVITGNGNATVHADPWVLAFRCASGWFYSLLGLVYANINKTGSSIAEPIQETPAPAPAPEPVDYTLLAEKLAPLLAPKMAPEPLDYTEIARNLAPLVVAPVSEPEPLNYSLLAETLAPLLAPVSAPMPVDYSKLAEHLAPHMAPAIHKMRATIIEEVLTIAPQIGIAAAAPVPQIEAETSAPKPEAEETEAERDVRLQAGFDALLSENKRISGRALADRVKCNRGAATEWLRNHYPEYAGATKESQYTAEMEAVKVAPSSTSGATSKRQKLAPEYEAGASFTARHSDEFPAVSLELEPLATR